MFNPCSASVQGRRECPPPCAPHAPAAMGHLFQVAPVTAAPSTQAAHANACCLNPTGKQSAAYRLQAQQQDQCDPPWATPQAQQHSPARVPPTPQCCPAQGQGQTPCTCATTNTGNARAQSIPCTHVSHFLLRAAPSTFGTHPQLAPFSLLLCTVDSLPRAVQSEAPTQEATALGLCQS